MDQIQRRVVRPRAIRFSPSIKSYYCPRSEIPGGRIDSNSIDCGGRKLSSPVHCLVRAVRGGGDAVLFLMGKGLIEGSASVVRNLHLDSCCLRRGTGSRRGEARQDIGRSTA